MANIQLTPKMRAFLDARVASGRYETVSEVVREGVRLLMEQTAREDALRAQLGRGRGRRARATRRGGGGDDSSFDEKARGVRTDG